MTQRLAILMILVLTSVPALADESLVRLVADAPPTPAVEKLEFVPTPTPEAAATPAEPDNLAAFHEVCDCECRIGSLVEWCDCTETCCITDEWCENPCACAHGNCYRAEDGTWYSNAGCCDVSGECPNDALGAVRFGYWGTNWTGSPQRIGEYQGLSASPFIDVDTVISDGVRTWDITATQLDNDDYNARIEFFGPYMGAKVKYQAFPHRLDHDPLTGFDLNGPNPPTLADNVVSRDLNVGEDYAIRVEQLEAKLKGNLTENVKWRLNVWEQRKFGDRQANATAHCYNVGPATPSSAQNNTCHILSQAQRIDWTTTEVQPVLEAQWEYGSVEYSRTMRVFGTQDEVIYRDYSRFGFSPASGVLGPPYEYALVPENVTQIDRLKATANVSDGNKVYANAYVGDTHNEFRDTYRDINGFDVRLINTTSRNVTWTLYANQDNETNDVSTVYLTAPPYSSPPTGNNPSYDQTNLLHPVDYHRTRAGIKGLWQAYGLPAEGGASSGFWDGLSVNGGYEYYLLDRNFATYDTAIGTFTQPETITHKIELGPAMKWSRELQTFIRYKGSFIDVPLIGVRPHDLPSGIFNTNQPEQVHGVEFGGTWMPLANFMATAQVGLENSWNHSEYADFNETNYPLMLTAWYAPSECLSYTVSYGHYSNGVDQDITLGFTNPSETSRWNYLGENTLVSATANYRWSSNVQFILGYEYDHGTDTIAVPASTAGADWSLLPSLVDVLVETQRITGGVDWQPYARVNVFARYIYYNFNDLNGGTESGVTHMGLLGASADF